MTVADAAAQRTGRPFRRHKGVTPEAILDDYPKLEADDVRACIAHAHAVVADDTLAAGSVAKP